jgi:hypothetical protein
MKKLRDIWASEIEQNDDKPTRIDVLSWLSKATLDVIGLAGTCSVPTFPFPGLPCWELRLQLQIRLTEL